MIKNSDLSKENIENVFDDLELKSSNSYPEFSPNYGFSLLDTEKKIFTTVLSSDSIPTKTGQIKDANLERPSK